MQKNSYWNQEGHPTDNTVVIMRCLEHLHLLLLYSLQFPALRLLKTEKPVALLQSLLKTTFFNSVQTKQVTLRCERHRRGRQEMGGCAGRWCWVSEWVGGASLAVCSSFKWCQSIERAVAGFIVVWFSLLFILEHTCYTLERSWKSGCTFEIDR